MLSGRWKDYPVGTTAYSYFFGAIFMGVTSLYYPIRGQVDIYKIPLEVRGREGGRKCHFQCVCVCVCSRCMP